MSNLASIEIDITSLLDVWIEAERNGVQFPVPLHEYWGIAGHKFKKNAFELVESLLEEGLDFLPLKVKTPEGKTGRSQKGLMLSVSSLEHLCMAAHTVQGRNVRELYRQAKAKWDIVQKIAPEVAQEVEILNLKIELAKIESQKAKLERDRAALEDKTLGLRQYIVEVLPKAKADRILGVTEITTTEIRDRIVDDSGFILNAANTVSKTELANRYGFVSKTGKADTKTVTRLIEEAIASGAISNPWHDIRVVASSGFDAQLVPILDKFFDANPQQRQCWMGEN